MEDPTVQAPVRRSRFRWVRNGCLGCLALVLLGILIPSGCMILALVQGPPAHDRRQRDWVQDLPTPPEPIPPAGGEAAPTRIPGGGRVEIDLSYGRFEIVAGDPGEPMRVEADYDAGLYELTEERTAEGELGWTWSVRFRPSVGMFRRLLAGGDDSGMNRVRITLPRGIPISLTGRIGIGESTIDLGGLWLTEAALAFGVGEHEVEVSEPLPYPAGEIRLVGSLGEFKARGLGYASPRRLLVSHRLGAANVDLRGDWLQEAEVEVRCGLGECEVRLPGPEVAVDLRETGLLLGEISGEDTASMAGESQPPPGAPVIHLSVTSRIGELRLSR